jgi:hypothetical protein
MGVWLDDLATKLTAFFWTSLIKVSFRSSDKGSSGDYLRNSTGNMPSLCMISKPLISWQESILRRHISGYIIWWVSYLTEDSQLLHDRCFSKNIPRSDHIHWCETDLLLILQDYPNFRFPPCIFRAHMERKLKLEHLWQCTATELLEDITR